MMRELFKPGDLSEGGGDLRHVDTDNADWLLKVLGDLSLGSLSFLAVKYDEAACIWLANISVANLGRGKDMGSVDLK